jgi:8-oxo-dGTP diphosphatase
MPKPLTPLIATDAIIELIDRPGHPIVLIERLNPPHGWALPGGFVDVGESVEAAAIREAAEECGVDIWLKDLLGVYSDPARDPRGHSVSVVYVAIAVGQPHAMDDAKALAAFPPDALPSPLAFDHGLILEDYARYRATGKCAAPRMPRGAPAHDLAGLVRGPSRS